MWAVRLNTAVRAKDAGKTIGNIRTLLGKSMAVVNLLLSDALMHRFYILGEKIRLNQAASFPLGAKQGGSYETDFAGLFYEWNG